MTISESGIYSKSIHGGKWLFITSVVQKFLNIFTFFILARLLNPRDYGVMAIVFLVVGFFDTMTTPGFEKALLQRQGDAEEYLDTIWTFKLLKALFIFTIIIVAAPTIAIFFHINEYVTIIRWGAAFVIIGNLSNSREFYFHRNLDFKKLFFRDVSTQIGYLTVAISWALWIEASVSALLAGQLTRYFMGLIMSYVLYPRMPRLSFKFKKLKKLWGYSRWVIGQNIIGYILGILDSIYVGHFLDSSRLGIYTKARDLASAPIAPFVNAIVRVSFPAYSKIQNNIDSLKQGFIRSVDVVLAVTVPFCTLILTEAGPIVQILLGKAWLDVVVPFKILSIAIIFSSMTAITEPIFDAMGRPEINVQLNIWQLMCSLIFMYFGVQWGGVNGVVVAILLIWVSSLSCSIMYIRHLLHLKFSTIFPSLFSVLLAISAVTVVAIPISVFNFHSSQNLTATILQILLFGCIYIIGLWLAGKFFKSGPIPTFILIIKEVIVLKKHQ